MKVVRGLQKETGIVHGFRPHSERPGVHDAISFCGQQMVMQWGSPRWDALPDDAVVTCFLCVLSPYA